MDPDGFLGPWPITGAVLSPRKHGAPGECGIVGNLQLSECHLAAGHLKIYR